MGAQAKKSDVHKLMLARLGTDKFNAIEDMPFERLCFLLELLEKEAKNEKGVNGPECTELVRELFDSCKTGNILLVFRLLLPSLDHERKYGMKEKRLSEAYIKAFNLQSTKKAKLIESYAATSKIPLLAQNSGDLSFFIHKARFDGMTTDFAPKLTLAMVNTLLDELAHHNNWSKDSTFRPIPKEQIDVIYRLYCKATCGETKWLTRIILQNLRLGDVDPLPFFRGFSDGMPAIYRTHSTLRDVCARAQDSAHQATLYRSTTGLSAPRALKRQYEGPTVGTFIGPQLLGTAKSPLHAVNRLAGKKACFVEQKYDGERIQLHITCSPTGPTVRIFSRSGRDSTHPRRACIPNVLRALGISQSEGGVRENIKENPFSSVVLDGELVTYSHKTNAIEPFGRVQEYGRTYGEDFDSMPERHLMVLLFDVLVVNGDSVMYRPLWWRKQQLERMVTPLATYVEVTKTTKVCLENREDAAEQIKDMFARCRAEGQEGLVIKNIDSQYRPHGRQDWLKLKEDYIPGLGDTLTLLLFGASYMSEKGVNRSGSFVRYHVGCLASKYDTTPDISGVRPVMIPVLNVENGLTVEEREQLNRWLAGKTISAKDVLKGSTTDTRLPYDVEMKCRNHRLDHLLTTNPIPITLLGSGFVLESKHRDSHPSLRHPRIQRIVVDGDWQVTQTFAEYHAAGTASIEAPPESNLEATMRHVREVDRNLASSDNRAPIIKRPSSRLVTGSQSTQAGGLAGFCETNNEESGCGNAQKRDDTPWRAVPSKLGNAFAKELSPEIVELTEGDEEMERSECEDGVQMRRPPLLEASNTCPISKPEHPTNFQMKRAKYDSDPPSAQEL